MNARSYGLSLVGDILAAAIDQVLEHPLLYALWIGWIVLGAIAVGQGLDHKGWPATLFAIGAVSCFAVVMALPRGVL